MPYIFDKDAAKQKSEPLPEGKYECFLDSWERRTLPQSGKEKISLKFIVRKDIDQPCQRRVIFDDLWRERENPNYWTKWKVNSLIATQPEIPNGLSFEEIDDVLNFLVGKLMLLTVGIDTYNDKEYNVVKYRDATKHPMKTMGQKAQAPVLEDDDGLPF